MSANERSSTECYVGGIEYRSAGTTEGSPPPSNRDMIVAVFLTLSGGFLDAFTYVGHGHVFANTMTGNVALLGVSMATGHWDQAVRHIPPLIAFACAIVVVHLLKLRSRRLRSLPTLCLTVEIVYLALIASGWIAPPELWLISGISFVATLQTLSFTNLENLSYSSVMTTGNLRRAIQRTLEALPPQRDPSALREGLLLSIISISFLLGAILGGYLTSHFHDFGLWGAVALLICAGVRIIFLRVR